MSEKFITTTEAARRSGLHPVSVRRLCAAGLVPGAEKVGRDWLIPEESLGDLEKKNNFGRPRMESKKETETAKLLIWAAGPEDSRDTASCLISLVVPKKIAMKAAVDIERFGALSKFFEERAHLAQGLREGFSPMSGHGVTIVYASGRTRIMREYKNC